MCGRFFRHSPREELAAAFGVELGHAMSEPGYNIAPGQLILAVRFNPKTGARSLDDLQWGLVPYFAKDRRIAWKTINARAETIDTSPTFRAAFAKRRCLVAVDGFFEWAALGKRRQPYAVALPSGKPFALAGLWEGWRDAETGEWLRSCTIVTTDANAALNPIHDRMPVIIEPGKYAQWLGEDPSEPGELKALLHPYERELKIWPVSPRMNKPEDAEGPEVLEPVDDS